MLLKVGINQTSSAGRTASNIIVTTVIRGKGRRLRIDNGRSGIRLFDNLIPMLRMNVQRLKAVMFGRVKDLVFYIVIRTTH